MSFFNDISSSLSLGTASVKNDAVLSPDNDIWRLSDAEPFIRPTPPQKPAFDFTLSLNSLITFSPVSLFPTDLIKIQNDAVADIAQNPADSALRIPTTSPILIDIPDVLPFNSVAAESVPPDTLPPNSSAKNTVFEYLKSFKSSYDTIVDSGYKDDRNIFNPFITGSFPPKSKTESDSATESFLTAYENIIQTDYQNHLEYFDIDGWNESYIAKTEYRIFDKNQSDYQDFLRNIEHNITEKNIQRQEKEAKILEQEIRSYHKKQEEIAEENRELYDAAQKKKDKADKKRRLREQMLSTFHALLFGSLTEEKLIFLPAGHAPYIPQFDKIFTPNTHRVDAISPIEPVKFSKPIYRPYYDYDADDVYNPVSWHEKIYAGLYRLWHDLNVFYSCIHPERAPPL